MLYKVNRHYYDSYIIKSYKRKSTLGPSCTINILTIPALVYKEYCNNDHIL